MGTNAAVKIESAWPQGWEMVHAVEGEKVRRMRVFGGWLYQVELSHWSEVAIQGEPATNHYGWGAPTFVPDSPIGTLAEQQAEHRGPAWRKPELQEHTSDVIAALYVWAGFAAEPYRARQLTRDERALFEAFDRLNAAAGGQPRREKLVGRFASDRIREKYDRPLGGSLHGTHFDRIELTLTLADYEDEGTREWVRRVLLPRMRSSSSSELVITVVQ